MQKSLILFCSDEINDGKPCKERPSFVSERHRRSMAGQMDHVGYLSEYSNTIVQDGWIDRD